MTIDLYAIKDELNGFTSPIPFTKEEMAKRYLKDQVLTNPTIQNTPEDFSIWKLGQFDTETGELIQEKVYPRLIVKGSYYVK